MTQLQLSHLQFLLIACYTFAVTQTTFKLAPSILSADFSRLGEQLKTAEDAGADLVHIDVMDGQFVPNITIGPLIVEACKCATSLPLDVHLMIVEPERYIPSFIDAGADGLTIHAEATPHVHRALQMIKERGVDAGLAVNPLTPLEVFKEALPYLDLALIMSVNPGFGGQTFIEASFERLRTLASWKNDLNPSCNIEVDGGVGPRNIRAVLDTGATIIVAGSAVYTPYDKVMDNINALRSAAL